MTGDAPIGPGRLSRPVVKWLGGIGSALVVAVVSGVILAYLPGGGPTPSPSGGGTTHPVIPTTSSDEAPFTVTAAVRGLICTPYIVDSRPEDVGVPDFEPGLGIEDPLTDGQVMEWEKRVGALPAYHHIELTLQGSSARAVILQGIDVVVVKRDPARKPDAVYRVDSGCGASLSPRYFSAELDDPSPSLVPKPGRDRNGKVIPAAAFPFTISSADPEVFIISAVPQTCDCTWYLRLRWLSEGRTGSTVIDDGGRPFHTVAMDAGSAASYYVTRGHPCATMQATQVGAWCQLG